MHAHAMGQLRLHGLLGIGYTPRARLLNYWATKLARGVQPDCTMTTQNSKIRLISSIALKSRLMTYSYQPAIGKSHWSIQTAWS